MLPLPFGCLEVVCCLESVGFLVVLGCLLIFGCLSSTWIEPQLMIDVWVTVAVCVECKININFMYDGGWWWRWMMVARDDGGG